MKENDKSRKMGLVIMTGLFPIWGLAIPGSIILFIVLLLRLPANVPIEFALVTVLSMALISILSGIITFIFEDDQIRVSKQGLSFPLTFIFALRSKLQRGWDELAEIKLTWSRSRTIDRQDSLTLLFQGGGYARLDLHKFNAGDLEQFLIAFESCAAGCLRDAELDDFEYSLQEQKQGTLPSYTQIWERSLSNRFSGATFSPLEPGEKIYEGRYHVLRQLGFGGFAAVYLARHNTGKNVVLKESVFPQTDDIRSKAEELFKREAAILSKLDHESIARVSDYFIENGRHYLVMEYIEGTDLNRLMLNEGPQPAQRVMNWAAQLTHTLSYLHGLAPPVVHRDISPDNILLKKDGALALIDFGAAKEIAGSFTGTIIGKQAYIAPEQFRGKPTPRSDIYALGATLHFLLTGQQPEPLSISSPASKLSTVPSELDELVRKCTQLDEADRPDSQEIIASLNNIKWSSPAPSGNS